MRVRRHWLGLVAVASLVACVGDAMAVGPVLPSCQTGDPDQTIAACTALLQAEGAPARLRAVAFNSRGMAHARKREFEAAIADFTEAIRNGPKFAAAYDNRGKIHFEQHDNDAAIADFTAALGIDSKFAIAYHDRGNAHVRKGDYDFAIADLTQAILLDPIPRNLNARGHAYNGKGDYDRAVADFDAVLALKPRDSYALGNRGEAWIGKHDYLKAVRDLNAAIEFEPLNASFYARRGQAFVGEGQIERALADIDVAIRLAPNSPDAYVLRGAVREQRGNPAGALADFRRAVELKSEDADALAGVRRLEARVAAAAPAAPLTLPENLAPTKTREDVPPPAPPPPPAAADERRIALVIGNARYASVPMLPNPPNDAAQVAKALAGVGFRVTAKNDLTRETLTDALASFAAEAETADWAVVYFAGHGIEMGGVNYLIPVDAKLATDTAVKFEAVPLTTVMTAVEGAHKLRLVILDACRANPFAVSMKLSNGSRGASRGLARPPETDPGMLVVYAAKDGETASDGTDGSGDSPFAAALVKELQKPGVEVRRLFDLVSDDVFEASGGHQHPLYYGHLPGREDFVFRPKS